MEDLLTALYRSVLVSMLAERSVLAQRANRCGIILSCSHSSPPCPPQVPGVPGHGGPGSGRAGDGALAADGHGAAGGGPLQGVGHGRCGAQHRLHIQVHTLYRSMVKETLLGVSYCPQSRPINPNVVR